MDVLWVAVALSTLLVAVGIFFMLLECRNLLKDTRKTVQITNSELPQMLTNINRTIAEVEKAATNVNTVATGLVSLVNAISSVSQKVKTGWFGTGLAAGIDLVKNLFQRRKRK